MLVVVVAAVFALALAGGCAQAQVADSAVQSSAEASSQGQDAASAAESQAAQDEGQAAEGGAEASAGSAATTTAVLTWSPEIECDMCHTDQVDSMGNSKCLGSKHASLSCTDCHADTDALTTAHADMMTADAPKKLRHAEVADSTCETCHDKAQVATLTDGVVVDAEGNTFNPHALTPSESHDSIVCSDCHKMHSKKTAQAAAETTCTSCHHKGIYQDCGSCHQ